MRRILISILFFMAVSCRPKTAPKDPLTQLHGGDSQSASADGTVEDPFLQPSAELPKGEDDGVSPTGPQDPTKDPLPKPKEPITKPLIEEIVTGIGTVRAEMSPKPGIEVALSGGARAVQVTLAELSQSKGAQPIERRNDKTKRDKLDVISVVGGCQKNLCVDGVLDDETRTYFIKPQPSKEEALAAKNGWVERLIRISSVGPAHTSIYLGRVVTQSEKTTQAIVECATFDRKTGKRLSVHDIIPKEDADKKLRDAKQKLREKYPSYLLDPSSFLLVGSVPRGIRFCALPPLTSNLASLIEIEP